MYAASASAAIFDASPNPAHLRALPGRTRQIIPENPSTHISKLDSARTKKKTYVLRERMSLDGSSKIEGVEEEDFIYVVRNRCCNFEKMCAVEDPTNPETLIYMEKGIIHPNSKFATIWNILNVVFIMVCMLLIPFKMAFGYETRMNGTYVQAFWAVSERVLDCFFVADIAVNFRVAYVDDDLLVQDKESIAWRYLRGWFTIDFISSVSSVLNELASSGGAVSMLRNLRILRLMRLLKLVRLLKLGTLLQSLDGIADEMSVVVRLCKIFIGTSAVTHLIACGFYVVGMDNYQAGLDCWQTAYIGEAFEEPSPKTVATHYLISLYWAFVTVTTVGFGDILPQNNDERLYVLFCTFIGTSVFAYMVGEITTLSARKHSSVDAFANKMGSVEEFMRFHHLPKMLRDSIRMYYRKTWHKNIYFNDHAINNELSYDLRRDVALFLKKSVVSKVFFFRDAPDELISLLVCQLVPRTYTLKSNIIRAGDIGKEMYILEKGEVEVYLENDTQPSFRLGEGSFFGEIALLSDTR
jgi:hypothetical protein